MRTGVRAHALFLLAGASCAGVGCSKRSVDVTPPASSARPVATSASAAPVPSALDPAHAKELASLAGQRFGLLAGAPQCGPYSPNPTEDVRDAGGPGETLFCHDGIWICDKGSFSKPMPTFEQAEESFRKDCAGRANTSCLIGTCGSLRFLKRSDDQEFSVRYFDANGQMVAVISSEDDTAFCGKRAMVAVQGSGAGCSRGSFTQVVAGRPSGIITPLVRAPARAQ